MDEKTVHGTNEGQALLIRNLVARFPMSCVCFEPIFSQRQTIVDFRILHLNAGFESIIGLDGSRLVGNTAAAVFGVLSMETLTQLLTMINETFHSETKTRMIKARVLGHVYKISFLFLSDACLLGIFEDIHSQFFQKQYHRTIPRDVISASIANQSQPAEPGIVTQASIEPHGHPPGTAIEIGNLEPLEILNSKADDPVPYDFSFRDPLTGLYDRSFAIEALRMFVESNVLPLSVALGDVNGLKTINESLGYHAGDELLIRIAHVLLDNCRGDDVVTRWNDGEFMLLLPKASQAVAQQVIKRLQAKLNDICGDAHNIVTFGYATSDIESRPAEDLIREAEKWIFQKKLLIDQSHRSSIIRLFLSMLHEKNAETQEHSDRMASDCRRIAKILRLSDEMVDDLILLSMLHDIGKIGIPDAILNKPAALTPEERRIINSHPEIGCRIAQIVPELKQVAGYILAHHERWDGTGYPKGLRGEEIPLASRIISVVDAFDVMVTGRNYQAPRTKEEAIAELKRCAGTQFDTDIVEVYLLLLAEAR